MINAGIEAQRTRRAVQDVLNAFTELVVDTKSLVSCCFASEGSLLAGSRQG